MSELSPGSKATTNLFMVLGIFALVALAVSVGNKSTRQQQNCAARLMEMGELLQGQSGSVGQAPATQTITLQYAVMPDGAIDNIEVLGQPSPHDELARQALHNARYEAAPGAPPLTCSFSFTLQTD
jgi:hypothetical protein